MMKCPLCGSEMLAGNLILKPYPGTLYPKHENESGSKHKLKMLFGSKDAISLSDEGEGWYCSDCNKVIALLEAKPKSMPDNK